MCVAVKKNLNPSQLSISLLSSYYATSFSGRRIILQPHNKEYHPIFRWICLVCGIIACELLVAILIFLFWLFIINLCTILVEEILRLWYQQIYEYLYATANVGFNPVCGLFQHIYQIICEIQDWFRRIFQSIQFV